MSYRSNTGSRTEGATFCCKYCLYSIDGAPREIKSRAKLHIKTCKIQKEVKESGVELEFFQFKTSVMKEWKNNLDPNILDNSRQRVEGKTPCSDGLYYKSVNKMTI